MFQLTDRYAIDAGADVRETKDGYLVASPRVARTGIQLYRGSEVGKPQMDVVRVYRPESEVFKADSMHSFAHRPVTDDHPPVMVEASNWTDYAKGQSGGEVARDGQFIRVPMVLMDGKTIKKYKDGKSELSVGYTCDITWGTGTTPDGEQYDAQQKDITANHIALVTAARGGQELRIGDGTGEIRLNSTVYADGIKAIIKGNINKADALVDADARSLGRDGKGEYPFLKSGTVYLSGLRAARTNAIAKNDGDILAAVDSMLSMIEQPTATVDGAKTTERQMRTLQLDGITIEVGDGNATEVIQKHVGGLRDTAADLTNKLAQATAQITTLTKDRDDAVAKSTTEISTRDAKIATLEKQVKDAELTPAKLDQLVTDRKAVCDRAIAVMADKASALVLDGKTDGEIRAQVVLAKLGDVAKGWNDDQFKTSFDTLTAGIDLNAVRHHSGLNDTARAFSSPVNNATATADKAYEDRNKRLGDAWKGDAGRA
jgi:hypothetical protein